MLVIGALWLLRKSVANNMYTFIARKCQLFNLLTCINTIATRNFMCYIIQL